MVTQLVTRGGGATVYPCHRCPLASFRPRWELGINNIDDLHIKSFDNLNPFHHHDSAARAAVPKAASPPAAKGGAASLTTDDPAWSEAPERSHRGGRSVLHARKDRKLTRQKSMSTKTSAKTKARSTRQPDMLSLSISLSILTKFMLFDLVGYFQVSLP